MRNLWSPVKVIVFNPHVRFWAKTFAIIVSVSLAVGGVVLGADVTWTNGNGGWDTSVFWSPTTPPGASDRAIFNDSSTIAGYAVALNISNIAVGDVLFSATTKGMFLKNSTNVLTVINSFVLDESAAATAIETLRTGTLAVTNSSGTAVFKVGNYTSGGKGLLTMSHQLTAGDTSITNYPLLIANNFLVTSNSTFLFTAGTLTTFGGSIDCGTNANLAAFAPVASDISTWNIVGGTNSITFLGTVGTNEFALTAGGTVNINVNGANTLLNVGGNQFDVGWNGVVNLVISNGGQIANSGTLYISRFGVSSSNNTVLVTGSGSQMTVGNEMYVGNASRNNSLTISAGGVVSSGTGRVGEGAGSSNNVATVTGSGSQWKQSNFLAVGDSAGGNSLIISNGGQVINSGTFTRIGQFAASSANSLIVDGSNSRLVATNSTSGFTVGSVGPLNNVTVKNGGQVASLGVSLGSIGLSSNNTIIVSGINSLWTALGTVNVGPGDQGNQLIVTNGGQFTTSGVDVSPANKAGSLVIVAGGALLATNSVSGAVLRVGGGNLQGTVTFNGGTITIDQLMLTNGASSAFNFNSGVLNVKTSVVANASAFVVGNGSSVAKLNLLAFSHSFANGLTISSNATLSGIGTISGTVTLANGATLAPGVSVIGTQTVVGAIVLNPGTILNYDLGAPGVAGDIVKVTGDLTLDGTLNVADAGGFTNGTYTVFSYTGSLTDNTLNMGALPAGFVGAVSNDAANKLVLLNVTPVCAVGAAGSIAGSSSVCDGQSGVTYSISSVSGATTYNWTVPAGASITAGQGTTSITVTWGSTGGNVSVTPIDGACSGTPNSLSVTVISVGAAGSIGGPSTVCQGQTNVTYSISSVSGATTYTWAVPSGASITSGQGTTLIMVDYSGSAISGNVTVTPSNGSCTGTGSNLAITVNTPPSISIGPSPQTVCIGGTAGFSVTASGTGLTYQWRENGSPLSDGGTIGSSTTASLTVSNAAIGDSGASFDCVVSGTCSPSATSSAATLTVIPTSVGGTAVATTNNVCSGDSTTFTLSGNVGLIQWQSSLDNATYANITDATNTTVSTGPLVTNTYYRAVVVSSPCSAATSSVASVTINVTAPAITAAPDSTNVCANGAATFSVSATGNGPLGYMWRKRGTGWANGWTLNAGGGGFFVFNSTSNNGGDPSSNGGNDISSGGKAWGLFNLGGGVTEALRPFPSAFGVGQTFSIDMDNGKFVDGTVGFGLQNSSSGLNRLEIYFVSGSGDYTISDATGTHDSGTAFTDAGINVLVRLTGADTYAVTITRYIDGTSRSFAGTLANSGAVDRVRLFDANGVGGSDRDLYFNSLRVACADDNAADTAYNSGWNNGDNGGQAPLVNGGDIAGADTDTLTISPAALLDGGSYDVCVDDGCGLATISSAATLTINPTPSCTVTPPSATICAGGSQIFTVNPSGGTPGYTYLWSNAATTSNITVSVAGSYSVTVTDSNGCTTVCSATLTINPTPSCTVTPPSATICVGGSQTFTVNPSGGTPGYTYLWSNAATTSNITVSAAGSYSVTVTDSNGCTTVCSATLTVNPSPSCVVTPSSAAICTGSSQTFTVNPSGGTPGYGYLWSDGSTGASITTNASGIYSVTVTDTNGCTTACSATLTVNPLPAVFNVTGGGAHCAGDGGVPVGLDGSQSGVNYQLLLGGNPTGSPAPGNGGSISFGNQTASGSYTVTASNTTTDCTSTMAGSVTVSLTPAFECWQLQYFGCTNCPEAATNADPDGDGQNNLAEFLSGTVPTNSASALRITSVVHSGTDINITWSTAGGHTNMLQVTTGDGGGNFNTNNFVDIAASQTIVGGSGDVSTNYVDVSAATNTPALFYRVRLVP